MNTFEELCTAFANWSRGRHSEDDGWEIEFPRWSELIAAAEAKQLQWLTKREADLLAQVWQWSEEGEEMLEFAVDHISDASCFRNTALVAESPYGRARWQAMVALSHTGERSIPILTRGLEDSEPYTRRRALLALADVEPFRAIPWLERFATEDDPYLRRAAAIVATKVASDERVHPVLARLQSDMDPVVREIFEVSPHHPGQE